VASVASFFISRIDTAVDRRLEPRANGLKGKAAVANARLAYAHFLETLESERWKALAAQGARPQRVLWASTSTKNPDYPETLYVDSLIGPHTVNTLPGATYHAFKRAGTARNALVEGWSRSLAEARETFDRMEEAGISMKEVTDELLAQGVQLFADAFDGLLGSVETRRRQLLGGRLARQSEQLGECRQPVEELRESWRREGAVRRLWREDASLWTGDDEARWLGWLRVLDDLEASLQAYDEIAKTVGDGEFDQILLLGMGGSSLCPDLLARTFGRLEGFPELLVLDSTVPAQVRSTAERIEIERALFVVSSKSGGTIEPNMFLRFFLDRAERALGPGDAARRFIAITDPESSLFQLAREKGFRAVAEGVPSIGGRFSALSPFGMLPARLMGLDVRDFLGRARLMAESCAACVPPDRNPGIGLGLAMGSLAQQGRDKLTLITSPGLASLGGWLEQLVAESTGKLGLGIVTVDGESVAAPECYGDDRFFAYLRLAGDGSSEQEAAVLALERAGQPVVRIELDDPRQLGQEFFRWEMATAAAGAVLGLNPFVQPDVESAKVAARTLMERYERSGELPGEDPLSVDDPGLEAQLAAHLNRIRPGDYFAVNAYLEMCDAHHAPLQAIRHAVRDAKGVATCLGYGPRFLHSTGQLHKGGPDSGVFLQLTCDDAEDLAIPGQRFSFGVLAAAQAQGDLEVLRQRGRRVLRLHLGTQVEAGLAALAEVVRRAVRGGRS
jgi:transaldolase/glucose-6-phosphate isomerase